MWEWCIMLREVFDIRTIRDRRFSNVTRLPLYSSLGTPALLLQGRGEAKNTAASCS